MATEENAGPAPDQKPNEFVVVMGGEELEVVYTDGEKETVKVGIVRTRHMDKFLLALDNEPSAVDIYCGKPPGWNERLTEESFNAVAEKGQALNLPFLTPWLRRRMARLEAVKPGFATSLDSVLKTAIEFASQSRASSPPPA
jgi:hypothetical protein